MLIVILTLILGFFLFYFANIINKDKSAKLLVPQDSAGLVTSNNIDNYILDSYEPTIKKSESEWRQLLTDEQYNIVREKGTEVPFTSPLYNEKRKGTYVTVDCEEPVFRSEQKFESGTGWPSFSAPINSEAVVLVKDTSHGMQRAEVVSKKCGSHLGHAFTDGPKPTGLRYCINGTSLKFIPDSE